MAKIKPFKALHFNNKIIDDISNVICPVYDNIEKKKYFNYINKSPYNIIKLESPQGYDRYNNAKNILNDWINNEILILNKKENIYIYEQEFLFDGKLNKLHGIICLVKVEDFEKKIIIPHENTLSAPKSDRLNLLEATKSNFSPIFSLYDDNEKLTENRLKPFMTHKPKVKFQDENNITHSLWNIDDPEVIFQIKKDFINRRIYIADGHHRYETAQKFKEISGNQYTMMFLVEMHNENLIILPTHRLIKNPYKFNENEFLEICKNKFNLLTFNNKNQFKNKLNELYKSGKHAFGIYLGNGKYYICLINMKNLTPSQSPECDVCMLHTHVIKEILHIDMEQNDNQKNIYFTRDMSEAFCAVDNKNYDIAFFLNPTPLPQIINTALLGEKMPQKSTYFYTKTIAGLTIHMMKNM